MSSNWTIKRVLDWTAEDFKQKEIPSARLEAELLLCHMLEVERLYLYTNYDRPLQSNELNTFRQIVARRRGGECTAHITGTKEFWSLSLEVTKDVLVPRPDTETLVQAALDVCHLSRDNDTPQMVLDLCTGSGCVALAIASECPNALVHATDVSDAALAVATRNVAKHELTERVSLFKGDLFAAVPEGTRYDVVVSNPPYVIEADLKKLQAEVQNEPALALVGGGDDGLDITRRLLRDMSPYLNPGAHVLLELDDSQTVFVANELGPSILGKTGTTILDLAGKNRVVVFTMDDGSV